MDTYEKEDEVRRPAVYAAFAFGTGILCTFLLALDLILWVIFLTAMLAFVIYGQLSQINRIVMKTGILICIASLGGICLELAEIQKDPLVDMAGHNVSLTGVITEVDIEEGACRMIIKKGRHKTVIKYYGQAEDLRHRTGKYVKVYGKVDLPQQRRNPGCFDYRLYLRACGIQTMITAKKVEYVSGRGIIFRQWTGTIRESFRIRMTDFISDKNQGLIMAILFGDKTMLDEELYSEFQKNGTAHVLAVSGLHTGMIYAFFVFLWRGKKAVIFHSITVVLLILYMSLADFSPSVVRAGLMILLHSAAGILKCRYDLMSAAGITFLVMLMFNPYQLFHTGFQLSFLAIVSLAVILPFVKKFYQGIFLSSVAIQAGMLPYTAYIFNYISLAAFFVNIPVVFIAGIMLPIGLCSILSSFILQRIFGLLLTMMELCCEVMTAINSVFYASGKTSFDVISPPVWSMVLYYGLIFFFFSETGQLLWVRKKVKAIVTVVISIFIISMASIPLMNSPLSEAGIIFVDVGQGDCMHIRTDSGRNYLIDGGGKLDYDTGMKVLKPYLLKNGVKHIDAAFVTHLHEDHYGGIRSLAADGMIGTVAVYEANRQIEQSLLTEMKTEIMYLKKGVRVSLDKDVFLDVLLPEGQTEDIYRQMLENEEDENASSLIMKVNYRGTTMLVTGDIDEDGEAALIQQCEEDLKSDIVKIPHHGSKYSSSQEFVSSTSPVLAVFQVGKNNYGHPSEEVMKRYSETGCNIVRNDINGAIGVCIKDDGILEVVSMIR